MQKEIVTAHKFSKEEKIKECKRLIKVYTKIRNEQIKNIAVNDLKKQEEYNRNLDTLGSRIINYKIILEALITGKELESDFPWEEF